jgi:sugar phosphate isomerase/epimerase
MEGERQHPMIGDTPMRRETLGLIADSGIKVLDIEAIWLRPNTVVKSYLGGFETAGRLGAKVIQVIGDDADEPRLIDTYRAICAEAAPFGLTVDLEYMAAAPINSLAKARRIVERAAAPNGGLLIDCLHMTRCGTKPEELNAVEARLIHVFQLCDGDAKAPDGREALNYEGRFNRRLPGEGEFDLEAIWSCLPPAVDISVEVPMGKRGAALSFTERASVLKRSADAFRASRGAPGRLRVK